jgi:hypothetical protein
MTTALVTGSHVRGNKEMVFARLDNARTMLDFDYVVCGGADYVDMFSVMWCMERKISHAVEYADWKRWKKLAGGMRNSLMLRKYKPDFVLAFDGDAGTADMKRKANEAGVRVYEQD